MNRYRTIPGLAPSGSKATTTTTCQKCLQKGHYSYECKASVQSRPYISRPSRSQQLQNPKLKPALVEQKMEESKTSLPDKANAPVETQDARANEPSDTLDDVSQDLASRKRRRSASSASGSSVATISTNASDSKTRAERVGRPKAAGHETRSRSSSVSQLKSPAQSLDKHHSRHYDDDREEDRPRTRVQDRVYRDDNRSGSEEVSRSSTGRHDSRHGHRNRNQNRNREGSRGRDRPDKRRRSRSADVLPDTRQQNGRSKGTRQRSLSPYSRRLALTRAMNAGG